MCKYCLKNLNIIFHVISSRSLTPLSFFSPRKLENADPVKKAKRPYVSKKPKSCSEDSTEPKMQKKEAARPSVPQVFNCESSSESSEDDEKENPSGHDHFEV